ncbi:MAG: hypothetical protein ACI9LX_004343 [Paraglaciecola sp.]|jgi:hypothetical protein
MKVEIIVGLILGFVQCVNAQAFNEHVVNAQNVTDQLIVALVNKHLPQVFINQSHTVVNGYL